jgi:hypothetical protein
MFQKYKQRMTIYIVIAVVKWEEPGYTSICGLEPHCKMQELSWQQQSIPQRDSEHTSL